MFLVIVECQLINLKGKIELENHHLTIITVITNSNMK